MGAVGSVARWLIVFHGVTLAWIFFRAPTLGDAGRYLSILFSGVGMTSIRGHNLGSPMQLVFVFGMAAGVLALESLNVRWRLWEALSRGPALRRWVLYYAAVVIVMLGVDSAPQQFIYFQF